MEPVRTEDLRTEQGRRRLRHVRRRRTARQDRVRHVQSGTAARSTEVAMSDQYHFGNINAPVNTGNPVNQGGNQIIGRGNINISGGNVNSNGSDPIVIEALAELRVQL